MLKKKYKPSRLNKWYVKNYVLSRCVYGQAEVTEKMVVWWCFLSSIYNNKSISVKAHRGKVCFYISESKMEEPFIFNASADVFCLYNDKNTAGATYKQIDGVIYEFSYDTPIG